MENIEIWKDILGYEGIYQISNFGIAKSLQRNSLGKFGNVILLKEKILKYNKTKGYLFVTFLKSHKIKNQSIHRLVAMAFIPNPDKKPCVNHINGIKIDNRIENLEWCTHSENTKHAFNIGLHKPILGDKNILSKLSELQVKEIIESKEIHQKLADKYKVSRTLITCIKNNKRRKIRDA